MTKNGLPDGVPFDNRKDTASAATYSTSLEKAGSDFVAPQTAIPEFAAPSHNNSSRKTFAGQTEADYSRVVVVVEGEDEKDGDSILRKVDDEDDDSIEPPHPPWPLLAAIAVALSLLAFYVVNQNTPVEGRPYCSDQPEWNQYNCDAG